MEGKILPILGASVLFAVVLSIPLSNITTAHISSQSQTAEYDQYPDYQLESLEFYPEQDEALGLDLEQHLGIRIISSDTARDDSLAS